MVWAPGRSGWSLHWAACENGGGFQGLAWLVIGARSVAIDDGDGSWVLCFVATMQDITITAEEFIRWTEEITSTVLRTSEHIL